MKRREFITLLGLAVAVEPDAAGAQQVSKTAKVGLLYPGTAAAYPSRVAGLRDGLQTAGYREPDNVELLVRAADGDPTRIAPLAVELAERKVDVIVAVSPGAPHLDQTFSRSDPVLQPTSPQNGVNDLVALLKAADVPGPYVLVAHSFSGTIARVFAGEHPDEVKGIVFVDVLTPELRAQMTPEEWKIWKRINARPAKALAAYPDLERQDFDETLDQTAAAAALRPMPVVVLTASDKLIDVVPKLIQAGELPPNTPPDFGAVVDRANSAAQNELAALVPGAVHITDTHSGHNIMIDNAPVVIQAIRMVVDAVRAGRTSLKG